MSRRTNLFESCRLQHLGVAIVVSKAMDPAGRRTCLTDNQSVCSGNVAALLVRRLEVRMRVIFLALGAALYVSGVAAAQGSAQKAPRLTANIAEGISHAGLEPTTTPYATGGPWAAVPASPQGTATPTVTDFRIRSWSEGAAARVLVFAVATRADGTESETQIASIALAPGESQEVRATEKYNARPVTISFSPR
jgi:hypothetical protein